MAENKIVVEENYTQSQLAKYNITDEMIAKMESDYMKLFVKDCNDTANYEIVKQAKKVVASGRIEVEKTRKQLKAESLEYGRKVDAEAKRITAKLLPIEKYLQQQEDIVAKENERRENERLTAIREKHDERVEILVGMGMTFNPIDSKFRLNGLSIVDQMLNIMDDEAFDQFAKQVNKESEIIALKQAEADRLAKEENEKQERIKAEQESERLRLQAIADEQAKQQAEIKRQQEEILNAQRKIEQDRLIEEAKKEAIKQAEIDRVANEKRIAEQKIEQEKQAKIEAERLESLKPDKKKLLEFAETIKSIQIPELKSAGAKKIGTSVKDLLSKVEIYIKNQTAELK